MQQILDQSIEDARKAAVSTSTKGYYRHSAPSTGIRLEARPGGGDVAAYQRRAALADFLDIQGAGEIVIVHTDANCVRAHRPDWHGSRMAVIVTTFPTIGETWHYTRMHEHIGPALVGGMDRWQIQIPGVIPSCRAPRSLWPWSRAAVGRANRGPGP